MACDHIDLSIYITDDKSSKYTYHNINNHTYHYHVH